MPHIRFNWVDIFFVTLLIRICYIGFKNGLLPEFFRLLGLLGAFVLSFNSYTLIGHFLATHTRWTDAKPDLIAFLFVFLFVLFIFKMLAVVATLFVGGGNVSGFSRLIGLLLGLSRGILLIGLIYMLFVNSPFMYLSRSTREKSFSGRYLPSVAPFAYRIGVSFYPGERIKTPLVKLLESEV